MGAGSRGEAVLAALAAQAGAEASVIFDFDALVHRCQGRVFRLLRALLRDDDAAQALTQESFLRAYQGRAAFRGRSSVETWLFSIAINLARDQRRSRRWAFWRGLAPEGPTRAATQADPAPSAEAALLRREEVSRVLAALDRLPAGQREVFLLRYVEDMALGEIAAVLRVSEGTVKTQLHRAIGRLRARLGGRR
jgi:RNA polymerase sigma-70 factor (ECF subfamily)